VVDSILPQISEAQLRERRGNKSHERYDEPVDSERAGPVEPRECFEKTAEVIEERESEGWGKIRLSGDDLLEAMEKKVDGVRSWIQKLHKDRVGEEGGIFLGEGRDDLSSRGRDETVRILRQGRDEEAERVGDGRDERR
jgi:hypothetical protein